MTVTPQNLRRYVIERAAGRAPRPEWCFYDESIGAWVRSEEVTAKQHEHHRRIRKSGQPWCKVIGHQTSVADDIALQTYFLTVDPDGWPRLAAAVREHAGGCLREWTASGMRIVAAVTPEGAAIVPDAPGPLSGWPKERGSGRRSFQTR